MQLSDTGLVRRNGDSYQLYYIFNDVQSGHDINKLWKLEKELKKQIEKILVVG